MDFIKGKEGSKGRLKAKEKGEADLVITQAH